MGVHATWRKCDFQLHTCRDPNWTGFQPPGVGDELEGEKLDIDAVNALRDQWADKFVEACKQKQLEAIAVTDHHEMVMIPYIKSAIARAKEVDTKFSLWLFPGMELTAKSGVQCLILFDADLEETWLSQASAALNINTAEIDPTTKQAPKVTQLTEDYRDLGVALEKHSGLKGRYIILPNVSTGEKHTVLKDGWGNQLKNSNFVGGYLDAGQSIENLGRKNLTRLSGKDLNWSNRFIYAIPTSDSRDESFSSLGSNNTWIKLSAPSVESIRQAFLASDSRIKITSPSLPSLYIEKVKISGSSILEPVEVTISKQLNSIIGGRGSGKSTFVEYVCFGLGRSCLDMEREQYSGKDRLESLVIETLKSKNGSVEVYIRQDGALFKITRDIASGYTPIVTYPNGQTQSVDVRELRSLFSAVVYSQNELAELGKRTGGKNDITDLLPFLHPDKKRQYDKISKGIHELKSQLDSALQDMKNSWLTKSQVHKLQLQRDSTQQRVEALEKSLPELSDEDKGIISDYEKSTKFNDERKIALKEIERIITRISSLKSLSVGSANLKIASSSTEKRLTDAYDKFVSDYSKGLKDFADKNYVNFESVNTASDDWLPSYQSAKDKRNAVLEKLSEHKNSTDQIIKLKDEVCEYNEAISDTNAKLGKYIKVKERYFEILEKLKLEANLKSNLVSECSDSIQKLSGNKIRASVSKEGDYKELVSALKNLAAKTGSQAEKQETALEELLGTGDVWDSLDQIRTEVLSLLRWKIIGAIKAEDQPTTPKLDELVAHTDLIKDKLLDAIDIDRTIPLAASVFKPSSKFTYYDGTKEIAFDKASEGQRAGALLYMLLEQEGGPLIIDQPEGDLDNKIISDIADVLHKAKEKRQLLFVSHNANLVVNGSSEFVGYVEVSDDDKRKLSATGAIDDSEICAAITTNMEGGEKAFKDRQLKYGF